MILQPKLKTQRWPLGSRCITARAGLATGLRRLVGVVFSVEEADVEMILVLQRVSKARVTANGCEAGAIGRGLLVFCAVERDDGEGEAAWCARKVAEIRVFPDSNDKMNLSVRDVSGEVLAVSQFTLAGDLRKGTRPSFSHAAPPEKASVLFDRFVALIKESGLTVRTGVFQAMMEVELVNDGPVTIILHRP